MVAEIECKVKYLLELINLVGLPGKSDDSASKSFLIEGFVGEATKDGVVVKALESGHALALQIEPKLIKVNEKGKMEIGDCEKLTKRLSRYERDEEIIVKFGDKILIKNKKTPALRATLTTDEETQIKSYNERGIADSMEFEEFGEVSYPKKLSDGNWNDIFVKIKAKRFKECLADADNLKNQQYEFQIKKKGNDFQLTVNTHNEDGDSFARDIPATITLRENIDLPFIESYSTGIDALFTYLDEDISMWFGDTESLVIKKENERYKALYAIAPLEEIEEGDEFEEDEEEEKDE